MPALVGDDVFPSRVWHTPNWTCPAGQNWTLSEQTCIRPDCEADFVRDLDTGNCVPDPTRKDPLPPNCPAAEGNPIDAGNGTKFERLPLLDNSVRGLETALSYASAPSPATKASVSLHGAGWLSDWDRKIILSVDADSAPAPLFASVRRPSGNLVKFKRFGNGLYAPDSDVADVLLRQKSVAGATTGWTYYDKVRHAIELYSPNGEIWSISNIGGKVLNIISYPYRRPSGISDMESGRYFFETIFNGLATQLSATGNDGSSRPLVASFSYDYTNNLNQVIWADGKSRRFLFEDRNFVNHLTGVIDENGHRYATWSYDTMGRAISSSHSGGVDAVALLYGNGTSNTTDPSGGNRVRSLSHVNGSTKIVAMSQAAGSGCSAAARTASYDSIGNLISQTDFNGNKSCHAFDAANREVDRLEGLAAGADCASAFAAGQLPTGGRRIGSAWHPDWKLTTRTVQPGKLTTNVFNGQPDPFSGGAAASCAPAGAVLPDGQPIVVLCKRVEQATTDSDGHLGFAAALASGVPARTQNWTHNQFGSVLSAKGPRTDINDTTTYTYYSGYSPLYSRGDLASVRNAAGHVVNFASYNVFGQLLQSTDANGVTTTYTYDLRQRLASRTAAANTSRARTTTYSYFPTGLLQRVDLPAGIVPTSAGTGGATQGRSISYAYDDAHRLTSITGASGERIAYTLDNAGNVTREAVQNSSALGGDASVVRRDFDALGRLWHEIHLINGLEQTTTYGHDANGNPTTTQWPAVAAYGESTGPQEVRRYNALDQLAQIEDAVNGSAKPTVLAVDPRDLITSVKAPNNATTGFSLDGFGQTLSESSPDRGSTSTSFDAAGNLKTRVDARGITASWSYDALNRPLSLTYSGSDTSDNQSYVWDANPGGPIGCTYGIGRLCRIDDATGSTHFAYDVFGNLTQQRRDEGGSVTRHFYGYDGEDRLSTLTTAANRAVALVRDEEGRAGQVLSVVNGAAATVVQATQFRADGQAAETRLGNQVRLVRSFDSSGQVSGESEVLPGATGGPGPSDGDIPTAPEWAMLLLGGAMLLMLARRQRASGRLRVAPESVLLTALVLLLLTRQAHADEALTIDERGNVQSRSVDGRISNYRYDPLDRLRSESGKATQSFGLDPNGNRSSDGVATYSVQANGNRLVSRNGVTLTYDAAGNLLADQSKLNGSVVSRSFSYSPAGLLRTASINGVLVATYSYDHLGLRSKKVLASPPANTPATTLYRYDPNGHLVEEIAGSGASSGLTLLTYLWKDDIPAAIIYAPGTLSNPGAQERIVYLHTDHLNTPRKASDAQGRIVWSWESDAFGSSAPNEDPGSTGVKTTINLRFPGQYYDQETGLSWNWHRYYDAQRGRYAQSDPIGLQGGINTYEYVAGQPTRYTDPSGLTPAAAAALCFVPGVGWVSCAAAATGVVIVGGTVWLATRPPSISNSSSANWGRPSAAAALPPAAAANAPICKEFSEEGRCRQQLTKCRETCQGKWERGDPPFSGSDAAGRMRRCIRECMEAAGCFNF